MCITLKIMTHHSLFKAGTAMAAGPTNASGSVERFSLERHAVNS